jgi:hypothetical protein
MPGRPLNLEEVVLPNVLVVEGKEEQLFFAALSESMGIANLQVMPIGGKDTIHGSLPALAVQGAFRRLAVSLGIIRDANSNAASAFASVCGALKKADLETPPDVMVPLGEKPRVTVMVLPGGGQPGTLEDLCLAAVAEDPAMHCVDEYMACLDVGLRNAGRQVPRNPSKARIHAFLSSRPAPDKRLGETARDREWHWPWEAEAFAEVKQFLEVVCAA